MKYELWFVLIRRHCLSWWMVQAIFFLLRSNSMLVSKNMNWNTAYFIGTTLSRDCSVLRKPVVKCMIASLCTAGQNCWTCLVCSELSLKPQTRQPRLSGDFIQRQNPGAGSLILNNGLVYRHCGSSLCGFTWIGVQFFGAALRSTVTQLVGKSLFNCQ